MPQTLTKSEKAVSANLQNTALISIGLLFFATGSATMSRVVLNIIGHFNKIFSVIKSDFLSFFYSN